jgi:hypothetical protein
MGQSFMKNSTPSDSSTAYVDPVIEVYKKDVDRTLLRERLRLTPSERFEQFVQSMRVIFQLRRAGEEARSNSA